MERKPAGKLSGAKTTESDLSVAAHPRPASDHARPQAQLKQSLGNQTIGRFLQAKLKVSQPNDPHEQEADRIAGEVLRMPDAHRTPARVSETVAPSRAGIQRACSKCEDEDEGRRQPATQERDNLIQTKRANGHAAPTPAGTIDAKINGLHGGGERLPRDVRSYFEPRFGHDFSGVRVHTGGEAAESAQAVNALAFTMGTNIIFGPGQYAPGTESGKSLLAHELTHVVQQQGGQVPAMIQRVVNGDVTSMSVNDTWTHDLNEEELWEQLNIVRRIIKDSPHDSIEFETAVGNQVVLEREAMRRNE
ncbi:MAG: DUF4157 domain-containing protein, partial [Pyrinomonadaceae bacterium]